MCAHYESVHDEVQLKEHFNVDLPRKPAGRDNGPGYESTLIRRHPHADVGDEALTWREALVGRFGLTPPWSKDQKFERHA